MLIPLTRGAESLSRQVYLWIRHGIMERALRPGEELPSTRELAEQNSISRTVVVQAYDQLIAEGFITGRRGSGTYVSEHLHPSPTPTPRRSAQVRLSQFGTAVTSIVRGGLSPIRVPQALRYDFAYGRCSLDEFPLAAWRRILLRRTRSAPLRSFDYGAAAGNPVLREAITGHLRRSRAIHCDVSQVVIVNGSQQALDLTIRLLLNPGDTIAVEDPQYHGMRQVLLAARLRVRPVPVDHDGIDLRQMPQQARLALVTPSHQFPTGAVLPLQRRLALLAWARRANAVIVEDDYDGEFRYEGEPVEPLQSLDRDGRVLYVGTFSRTMFPALRIGYVVAPRPLVSAFVAAKWIADRHTAVLEQETLAEFIASGAYERHLRRTRRTNAKLRDTLLSAVERHLGDRVTITGSRSGTHIVLWPCAKVSEAAIIAQAAAVGVGIYGIAGYYLRRPPRPGFLLGYANLTVAQISEGIQRLGEVL
ncbi:MAG: GntR family transcriptional regulator / MocR family aminotransferase [Acidobacteriaceae bacterium]|nr:GntR family transcriptional regulator / MocR family aminotransferase [Acidobacteriaceae bacterium]